MKRGVISLVIIISLVLVGLLAGCSGNNADEGKKYLIATDATYAPFEFEKDGKYVGIDIDLLAAIAEEEGFQYELRPMDFKGIIPALTSNQIDAAMSGMTITDKRKETLDFSEGYYESGTAAIIHKNNDNIKSEADFSGKIFAVKKGTVGSKYVEERNDKLKGTIKYFDDTPAMFQEVSNGNADITFEDYPVVAYMLSTNKDAKLKFAVEKLAVEYYGFAVNKGHNKELLDAFNRGLKKIKENGEYDKIVAKYLGN